MHASPAPAPGAPAQAPRDFPPPGWDLGRDLVLIVGAGGEALAQALVGLGQTRLLVLAPPGAPERGWPAGARLVHASAALFEAVLQLAAPAPAQVTIRRTPDPWATPARAAEAGEIVRKASASRHIQLGTVETSGRTWLAHGLANARALAETPSIALLRGACAGTPALIVSPGPSLSRNLSVVPALAGRALLLSGTHALHALASRGLAPELVVAADPGDLSRHLAGIDLEASAALVLGATSAPELFARPARRRFAFASNGGIDDWLFAGLGEEAGLASGGSVACSQFSLALHLGCDPILFVGQDLSFTERFYAAEGLDGDARVEASGSDAFVLTKAGSASGPGTVRADGRLQFTIPQTIVEVPGYHGGTVRTTPHLAAFLSWFEAKAQSLAGSVRLWNCTEGGAAIRGMEPLPLAEAARRLGSAPVAAGAPVAIRALLDRALTGFDPAPRRARLAAHLDAARAALERSEEAADRCRALLPRASRDARARAELGGAERELTSALLPLRLFVSLAAQGEIARAKEAARTARDLGANLAASRRLYDAVRGACGFLREPLTRALEALRPPSGECTPASGRG